MQKLNLADPGGAGGAGGRSLALAAVIDRLGRPRFAHALLEHLEPVVRAASCAIYRAGRGCEPRLFLSASRGVPDTTRECWRAYLSGPYLSDRTLVSDAPTREGLLLCHITAGDVAPEHRARVYEAHGVAERVSVVHESAGGAVFAVNFYRHHHQLPFSDGQLADFQGIAPALLALTRRHIELSDGPADGAQQASPGGRAPAPGDHRGMLAALAPGLTPRELDVCVRLLRGMTHEGIASDLALAVPTVKTYRNRAFDRLGIHFRNELFSLVMRVRESC